MPYFRAPRPGIPAAEYRHPVFTGRHPERLEEIIREVRADFETDPAEFNGENDHVHLPVNLPPKIALSRLANSLKGVSSPRMRTELPDPARRYRRANKPWPGSCLAGSVGGAPLSALRQYIEQQHRPGESTLGSGGPPTRAFTPGLKAGALARTSVADAAAPRTNEREPATFR
ncbi:IS200/IS605 family transposase [Actinocorallia sp. B10E7]|uniref:IS200/IS605 family transposase n=1 Tax=Actinocorallia sp. B10E7 TaxID=3153558 RepID=UPI00325F4552